ncbi:oligosaccharide flippase family protein [Proteus sp. G2658]|uniref:Wzx n=1 Tax=Proteus penneri TaxID=102862 RepID=A0A385JNV6_9GAMM|nr:MULTISPECIES: oligosaccharide flippase family protein [Proteus]AXY99987.1 wzx [Proteus penneri]NBM91392.1 oligosaccharide flippase family protein [Proteus sp. G2658]
MRLKNSINNTIYSLANIILVTILNIIYRTIFIRILGAEYLGVSAALTNIITLLSLTELGFSQAISYHLYKPLLEKKYNKTYGIMCYFKKVYFNIGILLLILGCILLPFLEIIIPTQISTKELNIAFFLFILNSSITYFWGYKRTLIIADQKNYKIIPYISLFQTVELVLKSTILFLTESFIITLLVQLIIKLIENIAINKYITDKYKYIFKSGNNILDKYDILSIRRKTIGVMYHKFGDVFINGTDNIIISMFVGVSILGIYSNYAMIIALLTSFILVFFNSLISSFGNLIIENKRKSENTFYIIQLISIYLFGMIGTIYFLTINDVIKLWIGSQFILPQSIVSLIVINFFLLGLRIPLNVVKTAGGAFEQDKYAPIIQGIMNLVLSILLSKNYGIAGVLLGTLISTILIPLWVQPYIVYKYIFNTDIRKYIINTIKLLFVNIFIFFCIYQIAILLPILDIDNKYLELALKVTTIFFSYSFIILLIKRRTFITLFKSIISIRNEKIS